MRYYSLFSHKTGQKHSIRPVEYLVVYTFFLDLWFFYTREKIAWGARANPNREPQVKDINFWTNFQIKNVGDRGTRVEKIVLSFVAESKKYEIEENDKKHKYNIWDKGCN